MPARSSVMMRLAPSVIKCYPRDGYGRDISTDFDEECIQKCDVLHRATGTGNAIQDEQNSSSVQAEMRDNARKVHRKTGASAHCIPENGQEVPDAGTRD
ncbi:uncharacterized protein LOC114319056 isoform X3 [Camellia sinensis]|nr:uncharacterized protein LOC114319056 isoform X3 [Camellia sinensis]